MKDNRASRRRMGKGQGGARRRPRWLVPLLLAALAVLGIAYAALPREPPARLDAAPSGVSFKAAPNFSLPSIGGPVVSLTDYRGRSILLYFHEGLGCPPCWQQNADIEKSMDRFRAMNISDVVTIVVDPLDAAREEYPKWKLTFPMLVDASKQVSTDYGALKNSMHPGVRPGHMFFLIDGDGNIRWQKDYYITGDSSGHHGTSSGRMYVPMSEFLADVGHAVQGHPA